MPLTTGLTIFPIMILGIILFISFITTATLGYLVLKGKSTLPRHQTMAKITIVILLIHGAIAAAYFMGL
ncbi:MAG: hypothetical protein LUP99_01555 [Methanomicrobiales archaeon]|nr:hypothetical protein [Methanomicrobiales archaeon]